MSVRWIVALSWIAGFAAALGLGAWLGRERGDDEAAQARGKRVATLTIVVCLAVILFRVALPLSLEAALIDWDAYALVRPWWPIPFALTLLAAGSPHMSTPAARRLVLGFAVLVGCASAFKLVSTARFDPQDVSGVVGPDGVCGQTTSYTCGAAAAAMLLWHHGVEASEREMAELSWTNAMTGTDEFCVARGLRQKLAGSGRVVRLETPSWEALRRRDQPGMATIKWSLFVDHWVVVREVSDAGVVIGDPIRGKLTLSEAEFREVWRGGLVTADRDAR